MNVADVMSVGLMAVGVGDNLDQAARTMWEQDCGFVPVVDDHGVLAGVVTDRDLCMASYTQGRSLADIPVLNVMAREPITCRVDDSLKVAMRLMQEERVHRLPVVGADDKVVGVITSNDLVQVSRQRSSVVPAAKLVEMLASVTEPRNGVREYAEATAKAAGKRTGKKAAASKAGTSKKAPAKKTAAKKASASRKAAGKKAAAGRRKA